MSNHRTRVWIAAGVVFAGLVAWAGAGQISAGLAHQRLGDATFRQSASPDELRRTAERSLAYRFGDPHKALLLLEACGTRSSAPYLRAFLERKPSGESHSCKWGHAEDALARATASDAE